MELTNPGDISEKSCRLCLKNDTDNFSILDTDRADLNLQDKIWRLYSVLVLEGMNHPTGLCVECFREVERSYTFYETVRFAQNIIRAIFSPKERMESRNVPTNVKNIVTKRRRVESSSDKSAELTRCKTWRSLPSSVIDNMNDGTIQKADSATAKDFDNSDEVMCVPDFPTMPIKVKMSVEGESNKADKGDMSDVSDDAETSNDQNDGGGGSNGDVTSDSHSESDGDEISTIQEAAPLGSFPSVEYFAEHYQDDQIAWKDHRVRMRRQKEMSTFYQYACEICEKHPKFTTFNSLCRHYKMIHKVTGYHRCCKKKLTKSRRLYYHMAMHLKPDIFKCKVCEKRMSDVKTLEIHVMRKHSDKAEGIKCPECSKKFLLKADFVRHVLKHRPIDERRTFVCDTCGKRLTTQNALVNHVKVIHQGIKEHLCDICAHAFQSKDLLEQHYLTRHVGPQNLPCPQCDQKCTFYSALRKHVRRHEEPKFKCTVEGCKSVYYDNSKLQRHFRVQHTDERPYCCEVCGKAFKLRNALKTHAFQHTGETPFQCAFCPRQFACKSNMFTHRRRMHAEDVAQLRANRDGKAAMMAAGADIAVECTSGNILGSPHEPGDINTSSPISHMNNSSAARHSVPASSSNVNSEAVVGLSQSVSSSTLQNTQENPHQSLSGNIPQNVSSQIAPDASLNISQHGILSHMSHSMPPHLLTSMDVNVSPNIPLNLPHNSYIHSYPQHYGPHLVAENCSRHEGL